MNITSGTGDANNTTTITLEWLQHNMRAFLNSTEIFNLFTKLQQSNITNIHILQVIGMRESVASLVQLQYTQSEAAAIIAWANYASRSSSENVTYSKSNLEMIRVGIQTFLLQNRTVFHQLPQANDMQPLQNLVTCHSTLQVLLKGTPNVPGEILQCFALGIFEDKGGMERAADTYNATKENFVKQLQQVTLFFARYGVLTMTAFT
jgi:hypothetical protein